jgi:two-component system phosphate regulon response regulator PhoB
LADTTRTIAVLVANPALASVLGMVLAAVPRFRVRPFDSELGLSTYMRLAPVDLLVADFDCEWARADRLVTALRADTEIASRRFQVIALTAAVSPELKLRAIRAGIDEVIVKPMSPRYLTERVESRLRRTQPAEPRPASLGDWRRYGANIIPLFPARPLTTS